MPRPADMRAAKRPRRSPGTVDAEGRSARPAAGFTLLELLVVLSLLGLVTALAVPNLQRLYASVSRTTERDHILDQFEGLGRDALANRRAYVVFEQPPGPEAAAAFPGYESRAIDVPEGWRIGLDRPLVVRANGFCLGGELTLTHLGTQVVRTMLAPPYCRAELDAGS